MFFSLDNFFAAIIILVTFFSPSIGLCGFLAVVLINIAAYIIGFNREEIQKGVFGFNALFLGLSMGYEFAYSGTFVVLFITSVLVLLLITVWMKGLFDKNHLPFLSFPFILTYWIVSLASSNFTNIQFDENHIYIVNEVARSYTSPWYHFTHSLDEVSIFPFALSFFKTLAGTFFQTSVLGGVLIAFGLLCFSRIAF